jgi:uncharacterized membrane protein YhhN
MLLIFVALLFAAIDVLTIALGRDDIRPITKPLVALVLAAAVARTSRPMRWLASGLVLAAIGDELLLRSDDKAFLLGMSAFAAMHLCYIAAFAEIGRGTGLVRRMPWLIVPYAIAAVGLDALLWPHAGRFAIPVAAYSVLLATMALSALDCAGRLNNARAARLLAGGALIFMLSDSTLALAKFWPGFPLAGSAAEIAVVSTYFIAQIAIATGAIESRP